MAPTTGIHVSPNNRLSRGQARFSGQIDEWVLATEQRLTAVMRESARRTIEVMQTPVSEGGNMPIDTGFLRASLTVVINGKPPQALRVSDGQKHMYNASAIVLEIAKFNAGDRLVAGYTANYALHVEYGARGREGRGFTRLAAQQWSQIVRDVTAEAKARVAARAAR
ncbi:hypothetical protein [Pseudaminobacter soli (ex Li et al. 2025)]|uniref:HK97 gp10 family phage protein n=1 Tax=Pseudaminobacter soli (ex Li et al. 2025) TaxID=1295366 RepID=A0A2P7SE02_9HYPH|nr:hypothetical protein [Mesorhizobium soli]PSJ60746.1 hypothetical protein C7I85_11940 [Mesorhizobium soli]